MHFTFNQDELFLSARFSALEYLRTHRVDVGLTSSASPRSRMLLAIHEHGAPAMHIPARPVIVPALSAEPARQEMASSMTAAVSAAMEGNPSAAESALSAAGEAGVKAIRNYIDAGVPPPNAPVTVHGGWVYNRVAKKGVPVEGKGFDKPLYDTGQLYRDFDFEIKERN